MRTSCICFDVRLWAIVHRWFTCYIQLSHYSVIRPQFSQINTKDILPHQVNHLEATPIQRIATFIFGIYHVANNDRGAVTGRRCSKRTQGRHRTSTHRRKGCRAILEDPCESNAPKPVSRWRQSCLFMFAGWSLLLVLFVRVAQLLGSFPELLPDESAPRLLTIHNSMDPIDSDLCHVLSRTYRWMGQ
jgi:hypothetical protein